MKYSDKIFFAFFDILKQLLLRVRFLGHPPMLC